MTIAVTGSSGFLGSRLVKVLNDVGHNVIELDIRNGFNIMNLAHVKSVPKFDTCIHLASHTFVPLSFKKPYDFYSLNLNGLLNFIELCRLYNAKMVFASSYVYGKPKYLPIDEKHPLEGFNPYSETKILCETICKNYFKYFGVKCIILRPFNIYGTGQHKDFLVPCVLTQAKSGRIFLKDPVPKRDFVFVDDVVECFLKAVESDSLAFEIFNVGYGKSFSVAELVEIVNKHYNNSLIVEYSQERRSTEINDTVADISKADLTLGWKPKIELEFGLKKIILENE